MFHGKYWTISYLILILFYLEILNCKMLILVKSFTENTGKALGVSGSGDAVWTLYVILGLLVDEIHPLISNKFH